MGAIQNAVNQFLATTAITSKLNPKFEVNKLENKYKNISSADKDPNLSKETELSLQEEQANLAKQIADKNPTVENVERYTKDLEGATRIKKSIEEEKSQKANARAEQKYNALFNQFKKFRETENKIKLITDPYEVEKSFLEVRNEQ